MQIKGDLISKQISLENLLVERSSELISAPIGTSYYWVTCDDIKTIVGQLQEISGQMKLIQSALDDAKGESK